jgi:cytosine/adenosine deaminase-related metal-dependent hydrolase
MTRYNAAWIVPIVSPPIQDGWVEIDEQVVTALGGPDDEPCKPTTRQIDLDESIILPSLVNAHTHLELSGLKGRVEPEKSMPAWVRRLFKATSSVGFDESEVVNAVSEVYASGTGLVGDITNTLSSVSPLINSLVDAVVFKELLGFNEADPETRVVRELTEISELNLKSDDFGISPGVTVRLAAHAPYSVSPSLFRAIRNTLDKGPFAVHVAESLDELRFLKLGTGPWRDLLNERGKWDPSWQPPGTGPIAYLESLGWLASDSLIVHGVHLTDLELRRLALAGATLVTCPRSNQWTGAGAPPIDRFYGSGVSVAVGTDSLASTPDLNLFSELAEMRRLCPTESAASFLRSATLIGARALGWSRRGGIAAGMQARLITVRCEPTVDDVEEYLVTGIKPKDIKWLHEV